jgi:hypothetical protein
MIFRSFYHSGKNPIFASEKYVTFCGYDQTGSLVTISPDCIQMDGKRTGEKENFL